LNSVVIQAADRLVLETRISSMSPMNCWSTTPPWLPISDTAKPLVTAAGVAGAPSALPSK